MEKIIHEIIQEFHQTKLPSLIKRDLKIPANLRKIFVIYGLRRAGKTYYLFQLIQKFLNKGYAKKQIFYLNFEDERLAKITTKDLSKIVELYYQLNPRIKNPIFFFDEIQEVACWEKFTRRLLEKAQAKIFLTGSSSKLLSREIATSLRGRTLSYQLFPLSLKEFIRIKNISLPKVLTEKEKARIKRLLKQYLRYGAYPEVANFARREKMKTLQEYLDLIIYRDLIERFDIKRLSILKLLLQSLVESFAKEFSALKYCNFLKSQGRKISKNTIYSYFDALEEVSFFFSLRKYSAKLRVIEGSLPKVYLTDLGYATLFGKKDLGRRMENVVALELRRIREYENILLKSFYYKSADGKEVDFIITKASNVHQLIQVCADLSNFTTKEREVKALLKASKELKCNNLLIITQDEEGEEKIKGQKIKYTPLWKWLLEI